MHVYVCITRTKDEGVTALQPEQITVGGVGAPPSVVRRARVDPY
jgi:hypothetical protein